MLKVLLVDDGAQGLHKALRQAGYQVVACLGCDGDLPQRVSEMQPDMIVIDTDSADRNTLERLCSISRDQLQPIVIFAHDDDVAKMREALRAGVSAYVVHGLGSRRVKPIIEVAMARFQELQALRLELDRTKARLAERKLVERARGIVMKQRRCTEDAAKVLFRKLAVDRHQRLTEVAQNVIARAQLLTCRSYGGE